MTWRDTFRTATDAVRTHRLRSALTMLGILIGITAVDAHRRARAAAPRPRSATRSTSSARTCSSSRPAARPTRSGVRGGFGSASTLTIARRRRARVERRRARRRKPSPRRRRPRSRSTNGDTNWTTTLTGTTPSWQRRALARRRPRAGSSTPSDEADAAAVVVLGPDTATELFGDQRPGRPDRDATTATQLEVIGVLEELELVRSDTSNNDLAIVPFSTYARAPRRRHRAATRSTRST